MKPMHHCWYFFLDTYVRFCFNATFKLNTIRKAFVYNPFNSNMMSFQPKRKHKTSMQRLRCCKIKKNVKFKM